MATRWSRRRTKFSGFSKRDRNSGSRGKCVRGLGAPGGTRTAGLPVRSQPLYPAHENQTKSAQDATSSLIVSKRARPSHSSMIYPVHVVEMSSMGLAVLTKVRLMCGSLRRGGQPLYVSQQLRHSSIEILVPISFQDCEVHWLGERPECEASLGVQNLRPTCPSRTVAFGKPAN